MRLAVDVLSKSGFSKIREALGDDIGEDRCRAFIRAILGAVGQAMSCGVLATGCGLMPDDERRRSFKERHRCDMSMIRSDLRRQCRA